MILAATTRLAEALLRGYTLFGGAPWLRARLMQDRLPAPADIWIHAASVGEVNSAATLITGLARDHSLLVTTNSETGRDRALTLGRPAMLAPLDVPGATGRFLDALRPRLAVTVEAELWPTRAALLAQCGIPHVVVGARMSARSADRWARLPGVIGPVLRGISALSAQDKGSEARLLQLGLRRDALMPRLDLKLLGPSQVVPAAPSTARDRTLLAASTHAGEDQLVLDAWSAARVTQPDLRLILAPRHPDRADAIAQDITARGLAFAQRSQGADQSGNDAPPVLLADTLGEMALWYDRSGICLTGGSLADHGGHTPWEPAAHGCAILHGPNVSNFTDAYAALDAAGAARRIDAAGLADAITQLAIDPAAARALGAAGRALLTQRAGDPAPLLALLGKLAKRAPNADIINES